MLKADNFPRPYNIFEFGDPDQKFKEKLAVLVEYFAKYDKTSKFYLIISIIKIQVTN